MLGFIFYTLAYVFFYGYYFGGKSDNIQSVLQVAVNPVPFNFKSLTMLGIFFVTIIVIFVSITMKLTDSISEQSKVLFSDIIVTIILFVFINMCFTIIFMGKIDFNIDYLKVWLFALSLIVYFAISGAGKTINIVYGLVGSLCSTMVIMIINKIIKLNISALICFILFICSWIAISVILTLVNFKKIIVYANLFLILYFFIGSLVHFGNIFSIKSITSSIIILAIEFLIKFKIKKLPIHITEKTTIEISKKFENKIQGLFGPIFDRFKYVFIISAILMLIVFTYDITYFLGHTMSKNMSTNSYDEIIYFSGGINHDSKSIKGVIVSYKDNVFYISSEDKELITIKNYIVRSQPYKSNKK